MLKVIIIEIGRNGFIAIKALLLIIGYTLMFLLHLLVLPLSGIINMLNRPTGVERRHLAKKSKRPRWFNEICCE